MPELWEQRLDAQLAQLAAQGGTISYGALAENCAVPGPGRIRRLTDALEARMAADAAAGQPLRAAVVTGRTSGGLPARGFYQKARALGLYAGPDTGAEAQAFQDTQRTALRGGCD